MIMNGTIFKSESLAAQLCQHKEDFLAQVPKDVQERLADANTPLAAKTSGAICIGRWRSGPRLLSA